MSQCPDESGVTWQEYQEQEDCQLEVEGANGPASGSNHHQQEFCEGVHGGGEPGQ